MHKRRPIRFPFVSSGRVSFHLRIALRIIFFAVAIDGFASCTVPDKPVEFGTGRYSCDYCMMRIADMRFRAEIITKKGKIKRFDSIECMLSWADTHPSEVHSKWVGDFFQQGKWIAWKDAHLMHSDQLASPMGAGLSAYVNRKTLRKALDMYKGKTVDKSRIRAFIRSWQKRTIPRRSDK